LLQRRTLLFAPGLLGNFAAWAPNARAAAYPEKPVTVLAPFAPGGTVDIVARLVGKEMSQDLHQTFLIENRGGAGGTIATALLAHAAPDGYTLMVQHMGLAFNAGLYDNLSFDTSRDVLPVANIGATPNVLVVTGSLPVKTVGEFLAYARKYPKRINYGSGGVGSAGHVSMEVLQASTGVQLTHVPYKGSGPAIIDLISGQIQAMLLTIPAVMSFIRSGKVHAIATSGRERSPALPNLPTIGEAGVKNFEYAPWYGLFAPRETPVAVVDLLHDEVNKVLAGANIVTQLGQQGLEVHPMSREQFAAIVAHDIVAWSRTIKKLGLRGE
jgi:tripartite-type tricarboxylate transporter receptor subunit TctC